MKRKLVSCLILLMLGGAIWWMSDEVVWLGDDLDYKYMMKGEIWQSWGRVKTVRMLFESQRIHYLHVNGRFVAHTLVQFFNAILGQRWFAVCNAFAYSLFAFLIGKAGCVRFAVNTGGVLSAACLSVLCFITKIMPTCQIGYIWGMLVNVAWLMLFFRKGRPGWLETAVMLVAGIIAGNWQESVSIGVCSGVGIWWLVMLTGSLRRDGVKFDWRRSWMILGYVVGTALNCLAPSTLGRLGDVDMSLADQFLIASYSIPAVVLLVVCLAFVSSRKTVISLFSFGDKDGTIPRGVLMSGMLVLLAFNFTIGVYSNRQLFGANLFAAILILQILPRHRFPDVVNAMATIAVIAYWALMFHSIDDVRSQYYEIARLHSESENGSVYIDRRRVMTLGFPLRSKYYEDILGQFDNDIHHSLMKDFKHVRKGRTLKIKPTASLDYEHVENYAPGHFSVTMKAPPKGEAPREVLVYGHYPLGIKANPRRIAVVKYFKRSSDFATAVIIPEFPFFTADSISILPSP